VTPRYPTRWADPRLAEAYDLISDVRTAHSTGDDKLPEISLVLSNLCDADDSLAATLRDRVKS